MKGCEYLRILQYHKRITKTSLIKILQCKVKRGYFDGGTIPKTGCLLSMVIVVVGNYIVDSFRNIIISK